MPLPWHRWDMLRAPSSAAVCRPTATLLMSFSVNKVRIIWTWHEIDYKPGTVPGHPFEKKTAVSVGWWTKSLTSKNAWFDQASIKNWLFGVPGRSKIIRTFTPESLWVSSAWSKHCQHPKKRSQFVLQAPRHKQNSKKWLEAIGIYLVGGFNPKY